MGQQIVRFGGAPSGIPSVPAGNTAPEQNPAGSAAQPQESIVTADQVLNAPMYVDELPPGTGFCGKELAHADAAYGPLFGTMSDDLGATWINVYLSPSGGSGVNNFFLQYAVFGSVEEAEAVFYGGTLQATLGMPPHGGYAQPVTVVSSSAVPGIAWRSGSSNPSVPMNSVSAETGVAALSGNVIIFTSVLQIGFAPQPALAPNLEQLMGYANELAVGSILHLGRLGA